MVANLHNSSVIKPTDFDDFWEETVSSTEQIPLNPSLTYLPIRSSPEVEVFDVRYFSFGGLKIA